jgi:DNA-binding CsgD family transcriptional regulator
VGRQAERQLLVDAADAARRGQPSFVLVDGEAGIGKSRLVADCLARVAKDEDAVLVGHGVGLLEGELPYGAMGEALRHLVHRRGVDAVRSAAGTSVEALSALAPVLSEGAPRPPDRAAIFHAFTDLITRLGEQQLVWLVIEDLQWLDTSSLDLLGYLTRVVGPPSRLLLTATLRVEDRARHPRFAEFFDGFSRHSAMRWVTLTPLSRSETSLLVFGLLGHDAPPRLVDRLVTLSDGIPYVAEELAAAGLDTEGPVPPSLASLTLTRLKDLSQPAHRLLTAAALGDDHVGHRLLGRVCALDDERLAAAVEETVAVNVLTVNDRHDGYRFRHALLREAIADSVLPGERLRLHERWAEQLETDQQSTDRALSQIAAAYHWFETGKSARAFDAALAAASLAGDRGASSERAKLLTRALDLWDLVADASGRAGCDRVDVLDEALWAWDWADRPGDAAGLVKREMRRLGVGGADPLVELYLRLSLANREPSSGDHRGEEPIDIAGAMRVLSEAPSSRLFQRTLTLLVWNYFPSDDPDLESELIARAVDTANRMGTTWDRFWTRCSYCTHLSQRGEHERSAKATLELLAEARAELPTVAVSLLEANGCDALCVLGRYREAVELGRQALERLRHPELSRWSWEHATENLCTALVEVGEWDAAESLLGPARVLDASGPSAGIIEAIAGLIHCHRGDMVAAESDLLSAESKLPSGMGWWTDGFDHLRRYIRVQSALSRGDHEAAARYLDCVWSGDKRTSRHSRFWRLLLLAAYVEVESMARLPSRRRGDASDQPRRSAVRLRELSVNTAATGIVGKAWTAQLEAEIGLLEGHRDPDSWQRAVDAWEVTGQVHDQAWALVKLARCKLASPAERQSAATALRTAQAIGARLRATPLLEAVAQVVGRARLDIAGSGAAHTSRPHPLTAREVEVLRLVAMGLSNDQIAGRLFISPRTASVHVSHILRKLDVASRSEATTAAHRLHLLGDLEDA